MIKEIIEGLLVLILIVGLIMALSMGGLAWKKFFAPKVKAVDRDIWEETPSRVLGSTQDIAKSMREYNTVNDTAEKNAICAYLRNSYPDLTPEKINDYRLRNFFEMCKYGEY